MKTKKLNFSEIKNALTRSEMKQIMAGSGSNCTTNLDCQLAFGYHSCCYSFYSNPPQQGTGLPGSCIACN